MTSVFSGACAASPIGAECEEHSPCLARGRQHIEARNDFRSGSASMPMMSGVLKCEIAPAQAPAPRRAAHPRVGTRPPEVIWK